MDAASDDGVLWALLCGPAWLSVALLVAAVAVDAARPARSQAARRRARRRSACSICGANGLFALATTEGLVSVAAVCSSLYPVVTILLARAVLPERIRPSQQIGVAW